MLKILGLLKTKLRRYLLQMGIFCVLVKNQGVLVRESACMREGERVQKIRRSMNVNKQNFTIKLFQIFLRRLKKILAVFLTFCIYKNPVAF